MRLWVVVVAGLLVGQQVFAQGNQEDPTPVYEEGFLGSMSKFIDWIDTLDSRFDTLVVREQRKQTARRLDQLAKGLYRLCASKEQLALSLASPLATEYKIRQDGEQVRIDLYEVRESFDRLGAMILRPGDTASAANEAAIRNGLGGKVVLVDQLVFQLRQQGLNRSRIMAQAKQAASLCRQAQLAATLAAARVPDD